MYVVRFVRKDGKPDELYYHRTKEYAEKHRKLFIQHGGMASYLRITIEEQTRK